MAQRLQQQLKEVGSKLESPPASKDALIKLLKVSAFDTSIEKNCLWLVVLFGTLISRVLEVGSYATLELGFECDGTMNCMERILFTFYSSELLFRNVLDHQSYNSLCRVF